MTSRLTLPPPSTSAPTDTPPWPVLTLALALSLFASACDRGGEGGGEGDASGARAAAAGPSTALAGSGAAVDPSRVGEVGDLDDLGWRRAVALDGRAPRSRLEPVLSLELDHALAQHKRWERPLQVLPQASFRVTLEFEGSLPLVVAGPADGPMRQLTPVSRRPGFLEATIQPDHQAERIAVLARDGPVTLRRLEARPWATAAGSLAQVEVGRLASVELDREVRPGWVLEPGGEQVLPLDLPADASRLVLAVGAAPAGDRVDTTFVLRWRDAATDPPDAAGDADAASTAAAAPTAATATSSDPRELLRVPVGGAKRRWREQRVDLSSLAGRSGALVLANAGPGRLSVDVPAVHCEAGTPRTNLVLISLDTTRPDRLGVYGYERDTTPRLSELAARGVQCDEVLSVSSYTLPSHATVFSGMHPLGHGVVHPGHAIDTAEVPLLAALLRERGYATRAFTGGGYLSPDYGFHHGFGSYGLHDPARPVSQSERAWLLENAAIGQEYVERLTALGWPAALDWVEQRQDVPFFLFLQTFAIHDYRPGGERARFGAPPEGQGVTPLRSLEAQRGEPYDELERRQLGDLYDGAIRRMDGLVGRVIDRLEAAGVAERTVIVLLSDHGETLGEHDLGQAPGVGHGFGLWDEQVRVPLIVVAPGLAPRRVGQTLSLVDVAPTLLELLGLEAPDAMQGRSLVPLLRGDPDAPPPTPVLLDLDTPKARARALYHQGVKLIVGDPDARVSHPPTQPAWLYDRRVDPLETNDLSAARPRDVERLRERLDALALFFSATGRGPAQAELSPETLEALAELGYLER